MNRLGVWAFWGLLFLLIFAIPIERRYDKLFRFYSKSLIPEGLLLPPGFDYKIFFFPSDIAVLIVCLLGFLMWRVSFSDRGSRLLWGMVACAFVSILSSGYAHYPLLYIRLWQWLTGVLLFSLLASIHWAQKRNVLKVAFWALLAAGFCQSIVAIGQYFHQGELGLRMFGEPRFSPTDPSSAAIQIQGGARWIFDRWFLPFDAAPQEVVRVMGTMNHPNVLGGFLAMTALVTFPFYAKSQRKLFWGLFLALQLFALMTTFSRSAMFGFSLGAWIWFGWHWKRKRSAAPFFCVLGIAFLLVFVFQEQLAARKGIFNPIALASDQQRSELQATAWHFIQNNPLTGIGYTLYSVHSGTLPVHNIYLLWTAETGLLSGFLLLLWVGRLVAQGRRAPPSPFLPALVAILGAFLFIGFCDLYFLLSQQGRLMFFLLAGLVAMVSEKHGADAPGNEEVDGHREEVVAGGDNGSRRDRWIDSNAGEEEG